MRKIWVLAALVAGMLVGVTAPAQAANILANAGFESGSLSPWACDGGSVVDSPARTGSHALAGGVTAGSTGQCTQTVSVLPSTAYTLVGGTSPDLRGLMTFYHGWEFLTSSSA
ncbi:hypothetical protein [Actinomadura chokoriensis]|uniref:hypothetical protein n=1 Tax=Actinomadura chokoriensis TaxID=454156 RepID=UPI0031F9B0DB